MKQEIIDEIIDERARQDTKYGGAAHDDAHSIREFVTFIMKHARKAVWDSSSTPRKQMIRVAALAIAVIEKLDRQND